MDEAAIRRLLRGGPRRRRSRPTTPSTRCGTCPTPTSASPASTTTARCARAWPRPSTGRARPPTRRRASSPSCWPGPTTPRWCSPAPTRPRSQAATDANPGADVCGTTVVWRPAPARPERVVLLTAGTADLPVADECAATLTAHGFAPQRITDVGVAGIHRLLDRADELADADAVVVVAGMEGALASVVGGLTGAPVVAVPTSVGYGAGLEGVTALLGMLASCAAGHHRGRHRQRVRRRLRGGPPVPLAPGRPPDRRRRRPQLGSGAVTIAWFHCFSGRRRRHGARLARRRRRRPRRGARAARPAAGRRTGQLEAEPVLRGGIAGTKVHVHAHGHHRGAHRVAHPGPGGRGPPPRAGAAAGAGAVFTALAAGRGPPPPAGRPTRSTSTRSAASTPSSTWSAPAPRSSCSTSTPSTCSPDRGRPRHGPGRPRDHPQPGARGGRAAARASPPRASTSSVELTTPTGAALMAALATGFGPMPADDRARPSASAPAPGSWPTGPTSPRW